ncbi:MAG TPA: hypothetical protein VNJ12_11600 [Candidatus Dormibacteraeota bacterium]|nr:hypothetical protein [Candidatus Dormibacteraeota bacterium]
MSQMTAEIAVPRPMYCDGCTREATPEHLRRRVERLEWASRFRPVRIGTLFLTPAPPAEMEDYFYFPEEQPAGLDARALQEDLLESCGIAPGDARDRKVLLRKFQEEGYFLTDCVECPIDFSEAGEFDALLDRIMPTLVRRLRFSYRPKSILLISKQLTGVAKALGAMGLEARLLMPKDGPVSLAKATDAPGRTRFRAKVADLLREAGNRSE